MASRTSPRERLLDATITSLRRHGVQGTGIAELLSSSGTARQSIYQHFPGGKAELVAAATRRAGDFMARRDGASGPHAHLDRRVDWWVGQLERHDFALGCPVAAAAIAGSEFPEVVEAAAEVFDTWTRSYAGLLVEAGAEPEPATALARFQISAIEGAILTARALRTVEPLEDLRTHLHRLVDDLLPH
ncbi:TetR/AcrR family transcriptional regulator [Aeromicrobium sp. HA]|uniref:TetR/AcrR family transcriptional regulator n=1 Tax=Aeromicrobium sp. HA TaxID=3009077 RepID=UPI0022AF1552|nr:TetR/AcrR family transcriptional regulator [Aeromicrobium sp. HA]